MKKFIVLDTETTNSLDDPLTYDIGFAVIDEKGKVYESYSFVIAEIFLDKELMKSAYFADKIPQYWQDIKDGKRKLAKLLTVKKILAKVMKDNHTNIVIAHNARFDYRSLATTQRFLTSSKYRYFLPYGTEVYCTLKMARQALKNNVAYDNFCYNNGYLTKRGRKRYTVEILYRFLTGQNDFVERHTGLEDVLIEKEIFSFCFANGITDGKLWD
mgnify:FL=1